MANKYLVETAIDVGIDNLKKLRNTDPKALYEEVKKEIATESSPEIKKLYQNYIDLYEKSLAATNTKTGALGEEIKWKNLGDLKKAVEAKGVGLSPSDREGLNQFALAEYARRSSPGEAAGDTDTIALLHAWFRIYESLKSAPTATVAPASSTSSTPSTPSSLPEKLKYDLKVYEGYAIQELTKSVRTIRDLKAALVMKGELKLEINNVFDQATLDAVVKYQTDKKLQKVDGLVGPETIGSLFGLVLANPAIGPQDIPYPVTPTPRSPVGPSGVPYPVTPGVQPQGVVALPEKEELSTSDALKQLNAAMGIFRSTTRDVSKKSGTFFDTPEEIEKYKTSINEALKKVLPILRTLESQKLSKTDKAVYDKTVLEIAKYFDNTLDGVKNRHYRNYDLAFDLALSLIKDDLKKQSIKIPIRPSEKEVLQSLKSLDPKLQKKIETDMRAGYELGQILSNPQVRSQWESVYEKVYSKYEDEMQTLLKSLKDKRPTMASAEGQRALDTMISIMGTKDFWDIKSRNRDLVGQTAGMVGSTVAGIGAFMATPLTGGTSAILGGAILSGVVTTAGMVATKGRGGLDRETAVELGINTITFGAGGALAKGANMIAKSGTVLARTAGIALDATGGLALGMGAEHVRAWEADTSITLSDSFKNNWYWALLPIALGAKGALRNKADAIQDQMGHAAQQAHLGDTVGAKATVAKAEKAAAELAPEIKAQQAAAHPTPSDLPPGGLGIGKNVKGATPEVAGETHAPAGAPKAKTSVAPEKDTGVMNESEFSTYFGNLVPKLNKKDFPAGSSIKSEGLEIKVNDGGKYSVIHEGKTYNYDSHADMTANIGKIIKTPEARMNILKSAESNRIQAQMKSYNGVEIPETTGLRWSHDGKGKLSFQRKNSETGSWDNIEMAALTADEQIAAGAHWYGVKPSQIKEGIHKVSSEGAHDTIKSAGLWSWFKERPSAVQKSITEGLDGLKTNTANGTKYLLWEGPKSLFSLATGIGRQEKGLVKPLIFSGVVEAADLIANPDEREFNTANVVEFIWRTTAFRYMGLARGTLAIGAQNYMTTIYPISVPGAEVPAPTTQQN